MEDILSELIQRRKEHTLKHRQIPKTIKLTEDEERRLRKELKKMTDGFYPPLLSCSDEAWQKYEETKYDLENTDKIFGMQIEVVG